MHNAQIQKFLGEIRASYWFIPSVMTLGAIVLSLVTVYLDGKIVADWASHVPFVFSSQPAGARALLSTVAGSMITVAGVTFSLTLLAVSYSTGQFGPRVIGNFMRDRGNQFTLGTFIATYIYCLMILRTVRSAEEPPVGHDAAQQLSQAFVPQISISVALVLTLASVAVLIYFIHHIPESIRLSNVVSGIGRQLARSIDELFPETIATGKPGNERKPALSDLPVGFYDNSIPVSLPDSGYVQALDEEGLVKVANDNELVVYLSRRPGDFHCRGMELLRAWPAERVSEEVLKKLQDVFALGMHRTFAQNVMFSVDQLVEIAQRALSPGVNDPMTAMNCMDWLQTALVKVTQRDPPQRLRYNENGTLRVFAHADQFEEFCSRVFDQLRQYVAVDRNASRHMMLMINEIRDVAKADVQRTLLDKHAGRLLAEVEKSDPEHVDFQELKQMDELGRKGITSNRSRFDDVFA